VASDPIKHVVVLMLENHSFDQMLGCMQEVYSDLDGVDASNPKSNSGVKQAPVAKMIVDPDPKHEYADVIFQIDNQCGNFVADYRKSFGSIDAAKLEQVMAYFPLDSLPVLHSLGRNFRICDRWFSSMPGPTWPNRYFVHSGTANGHVDMPTGIFDPNIHWFDQVTVYNRLADKGVSWKIYRDGPHHALTLVRLWKYISHFDDMKDFEQDARDEQTFPQYCFIEPDYFWPGRNDQHPPTDLRTGEELIARVYNALRSNEKLWATTLLVLTYDEHGGFYDHVVPPKAIPADNRADKTGFLFDRYGVRVPTLLISPWVSQGVDHTQCDHTSVLKYVSEKWGLGPLGARVANANSIAIALSDKPLTSTPPLVGAELPKLFAAQQPTAAVETMDEHQQALVAFGEFLEKEMERELAAQGRTPAPPPLILAAKAPARRAETTYDRFLQLTASGQLDVDRIAARRSNTAVPK
jgi:phospholipase C